MQLAKFSFGNGDRFGLQGDAQLAALIKGAEQLPGLAIVWNKSQREHDIVGTSQADVRFEADQAVQAADWHGDYHVDADHIGLDTVNEFIGPSDFFTLDVADFIGVPAPQNDIDAFVAKYRNLTGELWIDGIADPLVVTVDQLQETTARYLRAIQQAARIYRHICDHQHSTSFITEISLDETEQPQSPEDLFCILAMIADHKIPAQTIAPKFTGRFNKGVDYEGDLAQFNQEFSDDICIIRQAVRLFGLPANLKLSVHSGSDKFSIYPGIKAALAAHAAGVHVKTAGTTWLEELIGLAESGPEPLGLVQRIYRDAYDRFDELCAPYASVIDIARDRLIFPDDFDLRSGIRVARTIRHDQACPDYDPQVRQLLHVAYKLAAEHGDTYLDLVRKNQGVIGSHVCTNLFERHIQPLFL
jgi:hypothetical protein